MAFKKGVPRPPTAGRKAGTPNKQTQNLFEIADKVGVSPFEVMCMFAAKDWKGLGYSSEYETRVLKDGGTIEVDRIGPELRLHAAKEAAKYLYPQRKALEVSAESEKGFVISFKDYTSKK